MKTEYNNMKTDNVSGWEMVELLVDFDNRFVGDHIMQTH